MPFDDRPMRRLHPRTMKVRDAGNELAKWLLDWSERHGLTYVEEMGLLAEQMQTVVKYAIRGERHPDDPSKKGDEE